MLSIRTAPPKLTSRNRSTFFRCGRSAPFLDELIAERTKKNPRFPELLAAATARRALARQLVTAREHRGLSQTMVAAAMQTAQSVISKLEAGSDVKLSTMQRYCEAIGQALVLTIGARKPAKRAKARGETGAASKARTAGKTRIAGKAQARR